MSVHFCAAQSVIDGSNMTTKQVVKYAKKRLTLYMHNFWNAEFLKLRLAFSDSTHWNYILKTAR